MPIRRRRDLAIHLSCSQSRTSCACCRSSGAGSTQPWRRTRFHMSGSAVTSGSGEQPWRRCCAPRSQVVPLHPDARRRMKTALPCTPHHDSLHRTCFGRSWHSWGDALPKILLSISEHRRTLLNGVTAGQRAYSSKHGPIRSPRKDGGHDQASPLCVRLM